MFFVKHIDEKWKLFNKRDRTCHSYSRWDGETLSDLSWGLIPMHEIENAEIVECNSWYELYLLTHYCPVETDKTFKEVWISPEGKFYKAKDWNSAGCICDIVFGLDYEYEYAEDFIGRLGYIKAVPAAGCYPSVWTYDDYYKGTQPQLEAFSDWCNYHNLNTNKIMKMYTKEK